MATPSAASTFTNMVKAVQTGLQPEEVMAFYHNWHNSYDDDMVNVNYKGPEMGMEYVHKHLSQLGFGKDSLILDVGAGTGLQAQLLKSKCEYTTLDALDASQEMLDAAKEKNIYRNYFCCFIGGGHVTPIADNTYDAALMVGCFAECHLKCDTMLELMRIVKPGGIIVNVMREENTRKVEEYKELLPLCQKWVEQGLWRRLEETVPTFPKYYMEYDALVQVYQVC